MASFGFTQRVTSALQRNDVLTIKDLIKISPAKIRDIRYCSIYLNQQAIAEIQAKLYLYGLYLGSLQQDLAD